MTDCENLDILVNFIVATRTPGVAAILLSDVELQSVEEAPTEVEDVSYLANGTRVLEAMQHPSERLTPQMRQFLESACEAKAMLAAMEAADWRTPVDEGIDAFANAMNPADRGLNPYPPETLDHSLWDGGFRAHPDCPAMSPHDAVARLNTLQEFLDYVAAAEDGGTFDIVRTHDIKAATHLLMTCTRKPWPNRFPSDLLDILNRAFSTFDLMMRQGGWYVEMSVRDMRLHFERIAMTIHHVMTEASLRPEAMECHLVRPASLVGLLNAGGAKA